MTPRIAIGGLAHETDQYVAAPTTIDRFTVARGDSIIATSSPTLGSPSPGAVPG